MDSELVMDWVGAWGPLITLVSTVVLAAITAWLAYLTKVMAESARAAAEHSQLAAESSLASVAAAEASIDVKFDIEPTMGATVEQLREMLRVLQATDKGGETEITPNLWENMTSWLSVELINRGATVTVHGLKIIFISLQDANKESGRKVVHGRSRDLTLTAADDLPRLCHAGERVSFKIPERRPTGEGLEGFEAEVSYSFGNGPVRQRRVEWAKPRLPRRAEEYGQVAPGAEQEE